MKANTGDSAKNTAKNTGAYEHHNIKWEVGAKQRR